MRIALAVLLSCLAVACGSRSRLAELGADGAGGAPDVPGPGPTPACEGLVAFGPELTPTGVPGDVLDDKLLLTPLSEDGADVLAVFLRKEPAGALPLQHARLAPWDDWPSDGALAPVLASGLRTDSSHAVAPSGDDRWATLVRSPDGLTFFRNVSAGVGGSMLATAGLPGIDPVFVSYDSKSERHLVGGFDVDSKGQTLRAALVDSGGTPTPLADLGCAIGQPPRADAVAYQDGFVVAASRSSAPETCGGPPFQLSLRRVRVSGTQASLGVLDSEFALIDVRVAPHPAGAFAVFSTAGPDGGTVSAVRVDGKQGVVAGPAPVLPPNLALTSFAAGSIGDQLVVAWREDFAIRLTVLDESLAVRATAALDAGPSFGPSAVYGDPAGRGVLVGWTATPPGDFRVRLARFDCAP